MVQNRAKKRKDNILALKIVKIIVKFKTSEFYKFLVKNVLSCTIKNFSISYLTAFFIQLKKVNLIMFFQ